MIPPSVSRIRPISASQPADECKPLHLHALTPLFWGHVNPYGRFDLDMRTRLDLN